MTIKFYPSTMPGEPLEVHEWVGTFGAWLDAEEVEWRDKEHQRIFVKVNGQDLLPDTWDVVQLVATDEVSVYPIANGDIFKGLGNILGAIFGAVFGWLLPSQGGGNDYRSPRQGRQLEASEGKANTAKLGEVVPELAGRFRRFPDYLTPPRRYFASPREQYLEFLVCIGPGHYQINDADVKVGDTPFSSLGDDGLYIVHGPGVDLSSLSTHEHWYTVPEVGVTSSGTAGLELSTEIANRENSQPAGYEFDYSFVTRSDGEYPSAWGQGTQVLIEYEQIYSVTTINVTSPAVYDISEIEGYFGHVSVAPGALVSLGRIGSYQTYRVVSGTDLGGGRYALRFDRPEDSQPLLLPPDPAAALIFGASIPREIASMTASSITLADGPIFAPRVAPGTNMTFYGGAVYGEWTSEIVAVPGNEQSGTYEVDFFAPGGIAYIHEDGSLAGRQVTVEIQYRPLDGGASTTIRRSYVAGTLDQIGFTERISTSSMRAAFRVRRVSPEATETNIRDTLHWQGLKSRLSTRTSYPNWTTMSVKLRSGGRIAAQSENQINLEATRILPTLQADGTWGAAVATEDITAFARYILSTIGYEDRMDLDEWIRLHQLWTSRGEKLDHVYDLTTVKQALSLCFRAGMAEYTVSDGLIRPVREGVRTQFEQPYSLRNMKGKLRRTFKAPVDGDPDGVQVEYMDPESWSKKYVDCYLPGSQRLKLVKMKLDGIADRTRAWRFGMREAAKQRYRRWDYSFKTPTDALNSEYLSYVPLFDDTPGYGRTSLMVNISGTASATLVETNEPFEFEGDGPWVIGFRAADGQFFGPYPATPGPTEFMVMTAIPPNDWPTINLFQELPHVFFGPIIRYCYPATVVSIKPSTLSNVSVGAVNYDARIFQFDDAMPPPA